MFNLLFILLTKNCFVSNKVLVGHNRLNWVSFLRPFAIRFMNKTCIFSFESIVTSFRRALLFLYTLFIRNRYKTVFFVNGLPFNQVILKNSSKVCSVFDPTFSNFIVRWIPGFFSNLRHVLKKIRVRSSKKKLTVINNKGLFLECFSCIPSVCVFLSSSYYYRHAICETFRLSIPSIGVVDSDSFFGVLSFPIFGNDDSIKSLNLYLKIFIESILRGILNNLYSDLYFFTKKMLPYFIKRRLKKRLMFFELTTTSFYKKKFQKFFRLDLKLKIKRYKFFCEQFQSFKIILKILFFKYLARNISNIYNSKKFNLVFKIKNNETKKFIFRKNLIFVFFLIKTIFMNYSINRKNLFKFFNNYKLKLQRSVVLLKNIVNIILNNTVLIKKRVYNLKNFSFLKIYAFSENADFFFLKKSFIFFKNCLSRKSLFFYRTFRNF